MKIEFLESYLKDLYEDGKTKSKKHRFQPQVIKKFIQKIDILRNVSKIEELFVLNSLNYEVLTNTDGKQSIRVDGTYRIEFYTRREGEEPDVFIICPIIALSNHYQ